LVGQALELSDTPTEGQLTPNALVIPKLQTVGEGELELQSLDLGQCGRLLGFENIRLTKAWPYRTFCSVTRARAPMSARDDRPEDLTMIQLSERAVSKVKELLTTDNKTGYGLRVAVQGGGCSGFQYGLTFDNEEKPNDNVLEIDGLKVYVDAMSGMYLDGVKIDYIESLEGSGFKIENPNASGSCGCGQSFQA
jgi:iron-sulfur cluster assembly accessory protein